MRIVAGKYRGRRLSTPKTDDIRPTSDKIRGAVFNALHSRGVIKGALVLDLFCGTGALGIEALSRGAEHCIFVDKSNASLKLTQDNTKTLNIPAQDTQFIRHDACTLAPKTPDIPSRSLVFCDPPYGQNMIGPALENLHIMQWLAKDAFIVIETSKTESLTLSHIYTIESERIYGDTRISFVQYIPDAD